MSVLSESFVLAKTRSQDLKSVRKLNCWGNEIKDVSLLRRMPNVEVLCMSVNEITTLEDFSYCPKLQELYLRKNKIQNIAEIAHLQNLPNLKNLWFDENPCVANTHNYRKVVLRALPQLITLDNIAVTREELREIEELGDEIYEEIPYETVQRGDSTNGQQHQDNDTYDDGSRYEQDTSYDQDNSNQINIQAISNHQYNDSGCESGQSSSNVLTASSNNYQNVTSGPGQSNNSSSVNLSNEVSKLSLASGQSCTKVQSRNSNSHSNNNLNNTSVCQQGWSQAGGNQSSNSSISNSGLHLPKGGKNRNANILSAVLCLIKELDYVSCEVVQTALHCRIEETMNS